MRIELPHPSGVDLAPQLSKDYAQLVQQVSSPFLQATRNKKVFVYSDAAAGSVLPIFSNTAQKSGLFNPAGSGVIANIIEIALTYVSTTGAAGGFVAAVVKNAGSGIAGSGNLSAITDGTVFSGLCDGLPAQGKCRAFSAATVTAPVIYRHLGLNQLVITAADATNTQWSTRLRFDGDFLVAPNTAITIAGNIATLITMAVSITWSEEANG